MKISEDQNTIACRPALKAIEQKGCEGCYFNAPRLSEVCYSVPCNKDERADGKYVIFVEVKNVKTEKEI